MPLVFITFLYEIINKLWTQIKTEPTDRIRRAGQVAPHALLGASIQVPQSVTPSFDTNTQVLRTIKAANVLNYAQPAAIPINRCRTMIYEK